MLIVPLQLETGVAVGTAGVCDRVAVAAGTVGDLVAVGAAGVAVGALLVVGAMHHPTNVPVSPETVSVTFSVQFPLRESPLKTASTFVELLVVPGRNVPLIAGAVPAQMPSTTAEAASSRVALMLSVEQPYVDAGTPGWAMSVAVLLPCERVTVMSPTQVWLIRRLLRLMSVIVPLVVGETELETPVGLRSGIAAFGLAQSEPPDTGVGVFGGETGV